MSWGCGHLHPPEGGNQRVSGPVACPQREGCAGEGEAAFALTGGGTPAPRFPQGCPYGRRSEKACFPSSGQPPPACRGRPRAAREACRVPVFWKDCVERSRCVWKQGGSSTRRPEQARSCCADGLCRVRWTLALRGGHCVAVPLCRHLLCDPGRVISPLWAVLVSPLAWAALTKCHHLWVSSQVPGRRESRLRDGGRGRWERWPPPSPRDL